MKGLVEYTFQTRFTATNEASTWLTGQLSDLKKQAETLQGRGHCAAKAVWSGEPGRAGCAGPGPGLQRGGRSASASRQRLCRRRHRTEYLKGAVDKIVQSGDAELISGLSANGIVSGSPTMTTSLGLIQTLRLQEAALQGQIAQDEAKYGPSYPRLEEAKANLAGIDRALHAEVRRVAERSSNDYAVARRAEEESRREFAQEKREADRLNDKAIEYAIVRQEAEESRGLYEDLLKRLKEAGVLQGLRSSNITVVDPGRTPSRPKQPNVPLYLGLSLGAGLFLGACGALVTDSIDDKIQSSRGDRARPQDGAARHPAASGRTAVVRALSPRADVVCARVSRLALSGWRSLPIRTRRIPRRCERCGRRCCWRRALRLRSCCWSRSSVAGEGKSVLSANLSAVLAPGREAGAAGGRRPAQALACRSDGGAQHHRPEPVPHRRSSAGGHSRASFAAQAARVDVGADSALSGRVAWFAADGGGAGAVARVSTTSSFWTALRCLLVTDPVVLASLADATLLVARYGMTNRLSLARSHCTIREQSTQDRIGIVLNGVSQGSSFHYEYYGYSGATPYPGLQRGHHADN